MANKYYEPLYSRDGGPPRAYICLMSSETENKPAPACRSMCRTARGMELHLAVVHNFHTQITLDELIRNVEEARDGKQGKQAE